MDVIILAGGKGTRLKSVVNDVPKPMAPIGDKPFLEHLLNWIIKYPVTKIIFSVGYKASVISDYFKEDYCGIPIVYAKETVPLGTGGAILYAASLSTASNILVINGDTWFPISLTEFFHFHKNCKAVISIALKEMSDFDRYGTVELNGSEIVSFNEKKYQECGLINAGIYIINKDLIRFQNYPDKFSFEQEILEKKVVEGEVNGMVFNQIFIDIGVPEDYKKACKIL